MRLEQVDEAKRAGMADVRSGYAAVYGCRAAPDAVPNLKIAEEANASWPAILLVVAFGVLATAVVPQLVPIIRDVTRAYPAAAPYAGWLISLPSAICAVGALAAGLLVDRIGDRRMVLGGALLVALGDLGAYLSNSAAQLVGFRLVEGGGYLALAVGGATMLMRMTSGSRRRTALALWSAHTPIGFALALAILTPLAGAGDNWRWAFAGHGVLLCALALLGWFTLHPMDVSGYRRGEGTAQVLRTPAAYRLGFASCCCALLTGGFLSALPGALAERFGLSAREAAAVAISDLALNGAAVLATAALVRRGRSIGTLTLLCAVASFLAWATFFTAGSGSAAVGASAVFLAAMGALSAVIWGMLPAVTPEPRASGATSGLVTQATYVGVLLGPPAVFAGVQSPVTWFVSVGGSTVCLLLALALPLRQAADVIRR